MKIALAQVNFFVGDIEGNANKMATYAQQASKKNAHIVVFSELALSGYPPEDFLFLRFPSVPPDMKTMPPGHHFANPNARIPLCGLIE